jgi:hypothetical protein
MAENKRKRFLIASAALLLLILVPQVYALWLTLQQPFDELLSQAQIWNQLGILMLTPTLFVAIIISLPYSGSDARDAYEKPLLLNFIVAGLLQLVAAWQAYQGGSLGIVFFVVLAIFSFSAPLLVKQIGARFSGQES